MYTDVAETIGNVLESHGIKVLGDAVKCTTEAGLEKVNEMVKDTTGIELFDDTDIFENKLTAEQVAKLQKLENVKSKDLYMLTVEYAKIASETVDGARKMQETVVINGGWLQQNFIYLFAIFWSIFASGYILLITITDIPSENQRFADTILGFMLGTVIASILQFFFGSSIKLPAVTTTTKTTSK